MVTGQIDAGVPPFEVPPFSIPENATDEGPEHEINFSGMLSELGSAIIIIPIIAILESIAIAKAFCKLIHQNFEIVVNTIATQIVYIYLLTL